MPEFDIDNFKETWQQQGIEPKYNNAEILQMLNRKSRNYVKYILWISIAEFLFILGVSGYYYLNYGNEDNSLIHILEKMNVAVTPEIVRNLDAFYFIMKIFSIAITLFFVVKFYLNYKKIRVESNLKNFIVQIIGFKKTVNLFILVNILFLVITTLILAYFVFRAISSQNIEMDHSTFTGFVVGLIVSLVFSVVLIWLYYRLVYGIIMRRLSRNLQQLKEIEQSEE